MSSRRPWFFIDSTAITVTLFVLLFSVKVAADDDTCGKTYTSDTGSIPVPTGFTAKTPCTLTILRSETQADSTSLVLKQVSIAAGDSLKVFDGDDKGPLLRNYTGGSGDAFNIAIGFSKTITLVFVADQSTTQSSWDISYNNVACDAEMSNSWSTVVNGPVYAKTAEKKTLKCKLTVASHIPSDRIAAGSFLGLNLGDGSSLDVNVSSKNVTFTNTAHDFFADGPKPLVFVVNIADTTKEQGFSVLLEPVIANCSGNYFVSGTFSQNYSTPQPGALSTCRLLLRSDKKIVFSEITTLLATTDDVLTFVDGASSRQAPVDTISGVTSLADENHLVVASGQTMIASITFGHTPGARNINLNFSEADFGGRLTGSGQLSVGSADAGADPTPDVVFFLAADTNKVVNIYNVSTLADKASLTIYNGPQKSDGKLAVLKATSQDLKSIVGPSDVLVILSNLTAGGKFSANFKSEAANCDSLSSSPTGERIFSAVQAAEKDENCTWTIAPLDTASTTVVDMEPITLREKESLTVYQGVEGEKVIAKFQGKSDNVVAPQIYVAKTEATTNNYFRVAFSRLAAADPSTMVSIRYKSVPNLCGGVLAASGDISTPNFPNQYPLNAQCSWKATGDTTNKTLYLSFSHLSLAQKHVISVMENATSAADFGGTSETLPDDFVHPDAKDMSILFSSVGNGSANDVGGGAKFSYEILDCGGFFSTAKGSFESPEYGKAPTKAAKCIWAIDVSKVPGDNKIVNIVNFNLTVSGTKKASYSKYLSIYNGGSARSNKLAVNATSGTATGVLSLYDRLVIVYDTTSQQEDVGVKFDFSTHTCNSSQMCANGICMHEDWKCNGKDDCGDNTDERHCVIPPPPQSFDGYVKSGWVPACLFIGILLGAVLVFAIPRIVRRLRRGGGNYSRFNTESSVVA